ncbi:MAG: tRNA (N6-threonylcarbamoyladenosine(37)-N6)-methyltransferase TrmO [Gammaproteobacteria bacterium]
MDPIALKPIARNPIALKPIGWVRHGVPEADVPRLRAEMVSEIVMEHAYAEAIVGVEGYSHLIVLFWMHRCDPARYRSMVRPRGREDLPLTGVLSTRGRDRPNPIGLAVAELIERTGRRLQVRRLDAYDGTPVIDIKPYDPYDVVTDIRVPDWWHRLSHPAGSGFGGGTPAP